MLLRFFLLALCTSGLVSCIGLKPQPDTTKTYALGLADLAGANRPSANVSKVSGATRGYIVRPQLPVYMEGNNLKVLAEDGEIQSLPNMRWAEPVDVGVARSISQYIKSQKGGLSSDFYPWTYGNEAAFTLKLNFHHLIATDSGRILISADWEYSNRSIVVKSGTLANDTIEWSPGDPQSMVDGMNQAIELLARRIADSLSRR